MVKVPQTLQLGEPMNIGWLFFRCHLKKSPANLFLWAAHHYTSRHWCLSLKLTVLWAWASERGAEGDLTPWILKLLAKKGCFFQFRGWKTNFTTFAPPPGKNFGKIPYCSPEKILPTPMAVSIW